MSALLKLCDELDAKAKAATPGPPWTPETWVEQDGDGWVARGPLRRDQDDDDREPDGPSHLLAQKDAELMAAAVNAAPLLSRVVRAAAARPWFAVVDSALVCNVCGCRTPDGTPYADAHERVCDMQPLDIALDAAEAEVDA